MVLDVKQIFIDSFTKLFEDALWVMPVAFIIATYLYFYRDAIASDGLLTKREYKNLTANSLLLIIMITGATIAYLYIKEHFFFLSIILSVILTYFLYLIGFLDMLVEKLENR